MPLEATPKGGSGQKSSFVSPGNKLRGLKSLVYSEGTEEVINDVQLALRKAQLSASRRYEAAEWLRRMDKSAFSSLPVEPTEDEFCIAIRNGLILCNVLNKVNPGAVLKVVESPIITVRSPEGAAQSAIQYFENMRSFLTAVGDLKLLTFEASDLEKGGSSSKVVDCILCLKGYYEWKQDGGIGVWRYGGTVRITSLSNGLSSSSLDGTDSSDESVDVSDSSQYEQLMDFLHLSEEVLLEESKATNALTFLFDRFGLGLLQTYITQVNCNEDPSLNPMIIDMVLRKVVHKFSTQLGSQAIQHDLTLHRSCAQLGAHLKKILKTDNYSKSDFIEAMTHYLYERSLSVARDDSKFCICGGKTQTDQHNISAPFCNNSKNVGQRRKLQELRSHFHETRREVVQLHTGWAEELRILGETTSETVPITTLESVISIFMVIFNSSRFSSEHHMKGIVLAASSYHKVLDENRLLYNQVQDLKGSIRVFCRVRPFLSGQENQHSSVDHIGENGSIMIVNPNRQGKDARRVFSFNKVFGINATQEQIYADSQPLIRSVLDGYNVCIFAYGQTGSGKTFTMSGPDLTSEDTWGVNYRALRDLFKLSKARMDIIEYDIRVQMIEIYNEQVRDLLVSDGSSRRLDIRNNSQLNGLNVPDASLVPVKCTKDVLDLMIVGQKNRAVGATALNERSSRSHSILSIHVHGKELVSGTVLRGCLHLVDMAGSERVHKSEVVGERLKEAQHINKSLSALGDVISALAQKSAHVPYRNSKLTQVLQDSLGGQAKTLMFVHINPESNAVGETISTLKFAERVASVELGAARSNKESGDIRELKQEISYLKKAMEKKEAELQQLKAQNNHSVAESRKRRSISPPFGARYGAAVGFKGDSCKQSVDDFKSYEDPFRSCSSGRQRRVNFSTTLKDKEVMPKLHFIAEEKMDRSKAMTSPPPVRRSISTDRAHFRGRNKPDLTDDHSVIKFPFPARVNLTKSIASIPVVPTTDDKMKRSTHAQEKSEDVCSLQEQKHKKILPCSEEEQLKQILAMRQGGFRKCKPENRGKVRHQVPTSMHKSDMLSAPISATARSPVNGSAREKKFQLV